MSYLLEERETLVRYDEMDNCWYLESNVRRHITKILKQIDAVEVISQEEENGRVVWISVKLTNLEDYSINPFVRKRTKRELSDEQRQIMAEKMSKIGQKRFLPENKVKQS